MPFLGKVWVANLGCWRDISERRAVKSLEGKHDLLQESYRTRSNSYSKCLKAARSFGYEVFALQNGGYCSSAWNAGSTYARYGRSADCKSDGEGGNWANEVYKILKIRKYRLEQISTINDTCWIGHNYSERASIPFHMHCSIETSAITFILGTISYS